MGDIRSERHRLHTEGQIVQSSWCEYRNLLLLGAFLMPNQELSGVFEMRIYDGDFTVGRILEDCCVDDNRISNFHGNDRSTRQVDLAKLNARIQRLNVTESRIRRRRMNLFYEEVMVSADLDRGIGFNALLTILAHHKVINDNKSLR